MVLGIITLIRTILLAACDLYVGVILVYVLMSWIPNMGGGLLSFYRALGKLCDPFLDLFKRIIPPIGGMLDLSPIFAILVVQLAGRLIAFLL
ncbi:MAG: YggT family protein [Coriobacteriaceae bacterium]|nr:YggT family protein [Coriobacteriaceae bacterium]